MTTATPEENNTVTELPPAAKRRFRDRLPARQRSVETDTTEASETPVKGNRKLRTVVYGGALLAAAGLGAAAASAFGNKGTESDSSDVPSDTTDTTDN